MYQHLFSISPPTRASSRSQRDKVNFTELMERFKTAHSDYLERSATAQAQMIDAVALDLSAYQKTPSLSTSSSASKMAK